MVGMVGRAVVMGGGGLGWERWCGCGSGESLRGRAIVRTFAVDFCDGVKQSTPRDELLHTGDVVALILWPVDDKALSTAVVVVSPFHYHVFAVPEVCVGTRTPSLTRSHPIPVYEQVGDALELRVLQAEPGVFRHPHVEQLFSLFPLRLVHRVLLHVCHELTPIFA